MSSEHSSQFTLRDLFVATAIVGLICTFAPSCLQVARTPSRRNTCQSNQHNISLAAMQFAEAHRYYPGYANRLGSKTTSYLVTIMPYLEKSDIYEVWRKSPGTAAPPEATVYCNIFVCPSNIPTGSSSAPNAYVINAGQADVTDDAQPAVIEAGGIATDLTAPNPILISPAYVAAHDGASCTLLTSENLQAGSWALTNRAQLYDSTTFLWWNRPPSGTRDYQINRGRGATSPSRSVLYCRPASNHPGGVVVSFCGGNVRFIAEDIDYDVYKQLMTPNGMASADEVNLDIMDNGY